MAEAAEYHVPVSKVDLLHAGDPANADFTQNLRHCIEAELQLESQVNVKRRFKKEDNVAEEVVQAVLKLENAEEERRAVIIISQCLCEVMKNNQERSQAFQNKILEDLSKPRDKRRFALLCFDTGAASGDHFQEAFSQEFVDNFVQGRLGVLKQDGSSLNDRMPQIINEILRQWFGEIPNSQMEVDPSRIDVEAINTVRIVHGGDKTTVVEIGKELENGFILDENSKYKFYNRGAELKIPEVVLAEIREFLTSDGLSGLCVIVWCEKFFRHMKESQLSQQFEDLVSTSDSCRLVHVCLGVSEYEVKRRYTKLTGMAFLQLDMEDGGVVVKNLTPRILEVLSQARRTPRRQDQGSIDDMPTHPEGNQEARPPSSADRQLSEVSEPEALASGECQRPRLLVQQPPPLAAQPHLPTGAMLGLVGNPSNQNPQGGRVVFPAGSLSMSSAGYASNGHVVRPERLGQGNNGIMQQAQPTDDSNLEGQNWKYVANSGNSFNNLPSRHVIATERQEAMMKNGIANHTNGSYSPPDSSGNNNPVQRASLDGANSSSSVATSQIQASSSGSSTNRDRYLADGEHSMPLTSISSGNFGSQEPVLPSRDMIVETPFNPRGFPVSGMTSENSPQYLPSTMTAYSMSPGSSQVQFSGAPSSQLPTNKWAPNDFPSTEMKHSGSSFPNEAVRREAYFQPHSNMNGNLHSLEEVQRPYASKYPRRGDAGGTSFTSDRPVLQRGFGSLPSMSLVNNLSEVPPRGQHPYSSMSNNAVSGGPSSLPFYPSSSNNVPASGPSSLPGQPPSSFPGQPLSLPGQSSNNFNVSGLASALAGGAEGAAPIVQCTADGGGAYPSYQPSQDAFKQQDYRDIGPGQHLPNRQIGAQFMSNPAGQRCGEETNGGERADTTPGGLGQTAREIRAFLNPADQPIKEMDYRCRQKLVLKLDPDSSSGNNWKAFAYHYKMKHDMVRYVESKKSVKYTDDLLDWLTENKPDVTCGDFKKVAKEKQRLDVVKSMEKFHY